QYLGMLQVVVGIGIVELEDERIAGQAAFLEQLRDPLDDFRVLQAGTAQAQQQTGIRTLAALLAQQADRTADQPAIHIHGQPRLQRGGLELEGRDFLALTVQQSQKNLVVLGTVAAQTDDRLELEAEG